ncbi:MAG: AAA family ATPase [Phycisphaerae bacterium]
MNDSETTSEFQQTVEAFGADYAKLAEEIGRVIVGHRAVIDEVLTCLLAGGHALLEGVPGLGKTLLVRTLAEAVDVSFSRIQFTPDLMPADITGTSVVVQRDGGKDFEFRRGPIFANLVLADEINRATPKTQSAVLEAMQERTVSAGGTTRPLQEPFLVLATQNPLEMEGTYPLPEAQLDRFLLKISVESPSVPELVTILDRTTGGDVPSARKVLDAERVLAMRRLVRRVEAAKHVKEYVARLTAATHPRSEHAPEPVRRYVRYGASPRGAQAVLLAAKVSALRDGRANVSFEDARSAVPAALRHRLILSFDGQAEGIAPGEILQSVNDTVPQA